MASDQCKSHSRQACHNADINDKSTHGKEAATELWEENMKHNDFFHIL